MGYFLHLLILLWKNLKLQIHHPWITCVELLIPICFMLLLIFIRIIVSIEKKEIETVFESYSIKELSSDFFDIPGGINLYYSPRSTFLDNIMGKVAKQLNVTSSGYDSEDELVAAYQKSTEKVVAGVIFPPDFKDGIQFLGPISFTIRPENIPMYSWNLSSTMPAFLNLGILDKSLYGTAYMTYGFLPIQHTVTVTLMENVLASWDYNFNDKYVIKLRRFPFPPYESDPFYLLPEYYIAIALAIGFLLPSALIAKDIVHERETNLKQILILMGVSNWENWLAWYIKNFLLLFIMCLIMTFMLCTRFSGPAVFSSSDSSLILLWLLLYTLSIIAFVFFITTLFDKENSAIAATCILFILTFLPYIHTRGIFDEVSTWAKVVLFLLPNTLFAYSVRIIVRLEALALGLRHESTNEAKLLDVELNMNMVFLIFIIDILIYLILTWYVEVMRPASYQRWHPWYFPVTAAYWTGAKDIPLTSNVPKYRLIKPEFFEKDPPRVKPMIDINGLTKVYDKALQPVVARVDVRAYKGQITALLGHHDSGKTTVVSVICGSLAPTSGNIILKGYNVCKANEARKAARLLGICPEFDVAIDEFSIKENFDFFCRLKGYDAAGVKHEIGHVLSILDLDIKKERLVSSLSSSAKRRLTVGLSLIGESEIVILDEPTSRMDTYSRRIVWEALTLEKTSRAIFITTSHIKEANALADRIAVLQNGSIKCCGSPLFLKKNYGSGYQLIIFKELDCNTMLIRNSVLSKIPDAKIVNDTEYEIKFILPQDSQHLYHVVLKELEEKDMKISEIIVSEITLDELFERMTNGGRNGTNSKRMTSDSAKNTTDDLDYAVLTKKRNEGFTLFWQHMMASFRKRYIYSYRNKILTASQLLILPFIIMCSSVTIDYVASKSEGPDLPIFSLDSFGRTNVIYGIDPSVNFTIELGDTYASIFSDQENMILVDLEEENYLNVLLKTAKNDLKLYKTKFIIGAIFSDDFNKTLITVLYNSDTYHSAPASLLYVHNTLLAFYAKDNLLFFDVKNKPLPFKSTETAILSTEFDLKISYSWSQDLMIGMGILMSSFVVILVIEKSSRSKKQQEISGLNAFVYWFSSFLYDYGIYLIPCMLSICMFSFFQTDCLSGFNELGSLALIMLLHGLSGLLFIYCCAFCSKSSSAAYIGIFLYYLLGVCLLIVVYKLEDDYRYDISEILNIIFTILMPSYSIVRGIYNIHRNCVGNSICNNDIVQHMCTYENSTTPLEASCCTDDCGKSCIFWSTSHLSLSIPGIGKQLIALAIQPLFYILLLILLEMKVFEGMKFNKEKKRLQMLSESQPSAGEKLEEAQNILTTPLSQLLYNYYLILKGVIKFENSHVAVRNLSFGVKRGECFGLLGIDEAGKSAVLKMISGCLPLSAGDIYIDGFNTVKSPHRVQDKIGFSFGSYALLKDFTIKETLTFYAHIRGIPDKEVSYFIEYLSSMLLLKLNKLIKECSKTDRRKLSVAITIVGTPPIALLDEPTANMDPVSCMHIREALKQVLSMGCTMVLTSQRIEEVQALCKHIGILVKGKVTYLGDFNKLKKEYEGYTLTLTVKKTAQTRSRLTRQAITVKGSSEEIKGYIEDTLPEAILKIEYATYLDYYIPQNVQKWSKIFAMLEKMKLQDLIFDYTVQEVNLDKIFAYNIASVDDWKGKKIAEYLKERKQAKF